MAKKSSARSAALRGNNNAAGPHLHRAVAGGVSAVGKGASAVGKGIVYTARFIHESRTAADDRRIRKAEVLRAKEYLRARRGR